MKTRAFSILFAASLGLLLVPLAGCQNHDSAISTQRDADGKTTIHVDGDKVDQNFEQANKDLTAAGQQLKEGAKVRGTTVAELGNMNVPLDIVAYEKDGKNYLLIANNKRGVMKVNTESIEKQAGITEPVKNGLTAGLKYDTIGELKGVEQLDKLGDKQAVLLVRTDSGLNLQTIALP